MSKRQRSGKKAEGGAGASSKDKERVFYQVATGRLHITMVKTGLGDGFRCVVDIEALLDAMSEAGYVFSNALIECWQQHAKKKPRTIVVMNWLGTSFQEPSEVECTERFDQFVKTLHEGFAESLARDTTDRQWAAIIRRELDDFAAFVQEQVDLLMRDEDSVFVPAHGSDHQELRLVFIKQ